MTFARGGHVKRGYDGHAQQKARFKAQDRWPANHSLSCAAWATAWAADVAWEPPWAADWARAWESGSSMHAESYIVAQGAGFKADS